jgi:hypothetical protein
MRGWGGLNENLAKFGERVPIVGIDSENVGRDEYPQYTPQVQASVEVAVAISSQVRARSWRSSGMLSSAATCIAWLAAHPQISSQRRVWLRSSWSVSGIVTIPKLQRIWDTPC